MTDTPIHDHQLDLIMSLVADELEPAAIAAAETELAACEQCAVELVAQRLAATALRSGQQPHLTELESARMRRDLRSELGLVVSATESTRPAVRPRWQRMSVALSAAAVLLLVVAIVPALNLFGGAADSGDFAEAIGDGAATTRASMDTAAALEQAPAAGGDSVTNAEATTTTTATTAFDALTVFFHFGEITDLTDIQERAANSYTRDGTFDGLADVYDSDNELVTTTTKCADDQASEGEPFTLGTGSLDGRPLLVTAYVADESVSIVARDATTCDVVLSTD